MEKQRGLIAMQEFRDLEGFDGLVQAIGSRHICIAGPSHTRVRVELV